MKLRNGQKIKKTRMLNSILILLVNLGIIYCRQLPGLVNLIMINLRIGN